MEMDYPGETLLDHEVTLRTEVSAVGNSSFTVEQEALQRGQLCVTGKFVLVHFDLVTRKPLPIDEELRRKIFRWSEGETD